MIVRLPRVLVVLASLWLAGAAAALETHELQERIDSDRFDLPAPAPAQLDRELRLWATWYYRYLADELASGYVLRDLASAPISPPIAARAWCEGALQGSIVIRSRDGAHHTYSFVDLLAPSELDCAAEFDASAPWMRVAGLSRFGRARGPYGDGAEGYVVVPFRSLAVDPARIALGSVVYIPGARGRWVQLPDHRWVQHDGWFLAADSGGAIRGDHVDIFSGVSRLNPFPDFVFSRPEPRFSAYVVKDAAVSARLQWQQGLE